ncbi:hypothetical protein SPRG_06225 [Saprolegnia parasitica CBS 223.65]|uniref:Ion transport domain-containing protein n=1 Tax=Saprolegnia parasitica (strain CBS 223.65) TaxID=695850 RepID=A0A067CN29_SAPPC|nr:hypothetical protein SPRG_06225 [Saprolegnia parasitica CBS 223.65]KDO28177.1 hypothetical protein SPRG_06225 [Saprolegnia parasitica CBS 223.65]|eukprot:XP_012201004.1 hypothetical protein SPRG_06225 [Saprolegnia parasitica CBS 223.65]
MLQQPLLELGPEDRHRVTKAAWLVEDAVRGYEKPHPDATLRAVQLLKLYYRLRYVRWLAVTVLLSLSYIETPYWCTKGGDHPCGDPDDATTPLTFGTIWLSGRQSMAVEVACLAVIWGNDILLLASLKRKYAARQDRLAVSLLYMAATVNVVVRLAGNFADAGRVASFLRLLIFISSSRSARGTYQKLYFVLGEVGNLLCLVGIYVLFCGWLATILFRDTPQAVITSSFVESSWQLLILLTTANFPDVMMPAYAMHRANALFFICFVFFGLFFLMNVILAQVFSNFQWVAAREAATHAANRDRLLKRHAAAAADENDDAYIAMDLLVCFFTELNQYKVVKALKERHMRDLFHELDANDDGRVYLAQFIDLCDVVRVYMRLHRPKPSEVDRFLPALATSPQYQRLCACVTHRRFELGFDALLVINAVVIVIEFTTAIDNFSMSESWSQWELVATCFSCLFLLEMLLKLLVLGAREYWHSGKNRFDALITVTSLTIDIYAYIPNAYNSHTMVKVLLLVRCLRLLRLIMAVKRYRVLFSAWLRLLPVGKNILLVLFCNMNLFALLGHHLFGGSISPATMELTHPTVSYTVNRYFANNFNDIPSGMVTLFELLVVNNWYVIVDGHVAVTTIYARFFFISYWIVGVIVTLNLFIASILKQDNNGDEASLRKSLSLRQQAASKRAQQLVATGDSHETNDSVEQLRGDAMHPSV